MEGRAAGAQPQQTSIKEHQNFRVCLIFMDFGLQNRGTSGKNVGGGEYVRDLDKYVTNKLPNHTHIETVILEIPTSFDQFPRDANLTSKASL